MQTENRNKHTWEAFGEPQETDKGHKHIMFHSNEAGWLCVSVSHCNCTLQAFSCKSLFPLSFISFNSLGKRQRQSLSAGVLSSKNILHPRPKVHHILKGLWICMFSHLHPNVFLWEHYSVLVVEPKRTPIKTIFISSNTIHNGFIFRTTVWEYCIKGAKQ